MTEIAVERVGKTQHAKQWRRRILAALAIFFAVACVLSIPTLFFLPLPSAVEKKELEELLNLTIRPFGDFSSLPHPTPVESFEEFKKLAASGDPFLEISVTTPCIDRDKKKKCVAWGDERITARYSVLSPTGDGSWHLFSPNMKFEGGKDFYERRFKWDIDYDEDEKMFYRHATNLRRFYWGTPILLLVLAAICGGFLIPPSVTQEGTDGRNVIPPPPKPTRKRST